tara:strand:+ start:2735 stop:2917 length:183 start_codon:yes stop_codon:yes gene_type:complete
MPLFSDEINIFQSYCKEIQSFNTKKTIESIEKTINLIKEKEIKDKLLKEISILKNNIKYN